MKRHASIRRQVRRRFRFKLKQVRVLVLETSSLQPVLQISMRLHLDWFVYNADKRPADLSCKADVELNSAPREFVAC